MARAHKVCSQNCTHMIWMLTISSFHLLPDISAYTPVSGSSRRISSVHSQRHFLKVAKTHPHPAIETTLPSNAKYATQISGAVSFHSRIRVDDNGVTSKSRQRRLVRGRLPSRVGILGMFSELVEARMESC